MHKLIGNIIDEKAGGLEPLLNHMISCKDDPAINEHNRNITKKTTAKRHITHTIQTKPKHILKIIDIQMNIITTKSKYS